MQSIVNIVGLAIASYMDIKTREIEDYVWYSIVAISAPLLVCRVGELQDNTLLISLYALSLITGILFAIFIAYSNLTGGADAKALITLSITEIPTLSKDVLSLIPPLAIFINSTLLSLSIVPLILTRNLLHYFRRGSLFNNLENEPLWKKIVCILTAYKIPYSEYLKNKYKYSLAEIVENGIRRLKIGLRIEEENTSTVFNQDEEVWVNPLLPMIVFIEIGYVIYYLYGCILSLFLF